METHTEGKPVNDFKSIGLRCLKDIDELHQRNRRKTDDPYIRATMENVDYKK